MERFQPLLIILATVLGFALGQFAVMRTWAEAALVPSLLLMLTGVFLHIPLKGLGEVFRNVQFTAWGLGVNFIWTPLLAWALGQSLLAGQTDLQIGLLMLLVTPCTDWYLVFTQLAGGNVRLGAAQLPWHLLLQLLLLPVYLMLFAGASIELDARLLIESTFMVLVVPLLASILLRNLAIRTMSAQWFHLTLLPRVAGLQLVCLLLAIAAMFASQGDVLLANLRLTFSILPPLLAFYGINLALMLGVSRISRMPRADTVALCFATLARNSPIALVIAVVAFAERPLIGLTLIIGALVELPILALISQGFKTLRTSKPE